MRRKDIISEARDDIMSGMQIAIADLTTEYSHDAAHYHYVRQQEAIRQFRRVEKFLGYEPGSWSAYP